MNKKELIKLLNHDIESEHGAIIQYLIHAYAMGEGEVTCEIEAIAREEMRHLDWLAEKVSDLGGNISLTRGKMIMKGKTVQAWMKDDVLLEDDAIATYEKQLKVITDRDVKMLLERILSDEKAHHDKFGRYVEKVAKAKLTDKRGKKNDKLAKFLNWGVEHEYTVILQYLLHSYLAKDEESRNELQDQAINEMQHMGWLSEELVDGGGAPILEHTDIKKARTMAGMLKSDIKIEKMVAAEYDRGAREIVKDEKLRKLIIRIRDHEIYHTKLFNKLLKKTRA
jgi:bacterioferritin